MWSFSSVSSIGNDARHFDEVPSRRFPQDELTTMNSRMKNISLVFLIAKRTERLNSNQRTWKTVEPDVLNLPRDASGASIVSQVRVCSKAFRFFEFQKSRRIVLYRGL